MKGEHVFHFPQEIGFAVRQRENAHILFLEAMSAISAVDKHESCVGFMALASLHDPLFLTQESIKNR